jgi:hypothetical protein
MAKQIRSKIGEIHQVRTVKTFGDHVKRIADVIGVIVVFLVIFGLLAQLFG